MAEEDKNPVAPKVRKQDEDEPAEQQEETAEASKAPAAARTTDDAPAGDEPALLGGFGPNAEPLEVPGGVAPEPDTRPRPGRRVVDAAEMKRRNEADKARKKKERAAAEAGDPSPTTSARAASDGEMMTFEEGSVEDFEAMLAGTGVVPETRRYSVGDEVTGTVVKIGERYVYVDLGGSYEATGKIADFRDEEGNFPFSVGDEETFFITDLRGGTITLGHEISTRDSAMGAIEMAFSSGLPIDGRVTSHNKGGFVVQIGGVEAFCPISQIELGFTEEPSVHVGNSYKFQVIEIREDGRSVVVSRTALLEEEAKAARKRTLEQIQVGSVVTGVVKRITDFGAFVDIGGIEGLVHISELGYQHVDHPSEALSEGDSIEVEVIKMQEDGDRLKIGLSRKNLMKDPWEAAFEELSPGDEINGTVVRLESFGAFVELRPGVEGLVHVSEMSWVKRVTHPSDVVSVGDTILVKIKEIDLQRRRISLSMKSAEGDPWADIEDTYSLGQELTGTVEKVEDFGAFIRLDAGVTALLPRSEMELNRNETVFSKAIKGTEMTARVISIEPERRRMALSLKSEAELEETRGEATPQVYEEASGGGFGTLGDLLKGKIDKD